MNNIIKKTICVLEDDDAIREVIILLLTEEDYQVISFASVGGFFKDPHSINPDLFLLDVMLQDGNGIEVCSKLKSNILTSHIPVLMMSANFDKYQVHTSCAAQGFIAKPFDIYDLLKKVDFALSLPPLAS